MTIPQFVITMPAFNEASGIESFIVELCSSFESEDLALCLIVVDDCSTDNTQSVLANLRSQGFPIIAVRNNENLGHGPSTIRALHLALETNCSIVVAIDGDGQFKGSEVATLCKSFVSSTCDLLEGARLRLKEPWYRRAISMFTRVIVFAFTRRIVRDANTPLRVYRNIC